MKYIPYRIQAGFTLIELMITIAVVAILATITVPTYLGYMARARYAQVIDSTEPYTLAVAECVQIQGLTGSTITGCGNGVNGVPVAIGANVLPGVASVTVADSGKITVNPTGTVGSINTSDTYILDPVLSNGSVSWNVDSSSGALVDGLASGGS